MTKVVIKEVTIKRDPPFIPASSSYHPAYREAQNMIETAPLVGRALCGVLIGLAGLYILTKPPVYDCIRRSLQEIGALYSPPNNLYNGLEEKIKE
jgi:hypothetical protein